MFFKNTKAIKYLLMIYLALSVFTLNAEPVKTSLSPLLTPQNSPFYYTVLSQRQLVVDDVESELSAYDLIRAFGGKRNIESPDLYQENHPGKPHIYKSTDNEVGNHLVFTLHRDQDTDRDGRKNDRQRNEIKAYGGSERALKAYQHEMMAYSWKFKLNEELSVSKNFSHFFQLKAVDDGPGSPILTISGRDKRGEWLEVIHTIHNKLTLLKKVPLAPLKGKWLEVKCFVNYQDLGQLELFVSEVTSNRTVLHLSLNDIDMWRGTKDKDFVRPKWGFYRSLRSKEMLRSEEEKVYFSDFTVQKLAANLK